jgi:hypothetical protein
MSVLIVLFLREVSLKELKALGYQFGFILFYFKDILVSVLCIKQYKKFNVSLINIVMINGHIENTLLS